MEYNQRLLANSVIFKNFQLKDDPSFYKLYILRVTEEPVNGTAYMVLIFKDHYLYRTHVEFIPTEKDKLLTDTSRFWTRLRDRAFKRGRQPKVY